MKHLAFPGVIAMALLLPCVAQTPGGDSQICSRQQEDANKNLVLSIKPNETSNYMDPDYIQHNPAYIRFGELNGVSGVAAVKLLEKNIFGNRGPMAPPKLPPGQPHDNFTYKVIAECDTVVVVGQHWHPYPDDPTKFYATYFFNMWTIRNGKLLEHWDPDDLPKPLPDYLKHPLNEVKPGAVPAASDAKEKQ